MLSKMSCDTRPLLPQERREDNRTGMKSAVALNNNQQWFDKAGIISHSVLKYVYRSYARINTQTPVASEEISIWPVKQTTGRPQ